MSERMDEASASEAEEAGPHSQGDGAAESDPGQEEEGGEAELSEEETSEMEEDGEFTSDLDSSMEYEPEPIIFNLLRQRDIAGVRDLLTSDRTVLHCRDSMDHTPIHYPSMLRSGSAEDESYAIDMAKLLLSHGALVNSKASDYTPLHIACLLGKKRLSDLLLTNGARYDLRAEGMTPLQKAGNSKNLSKRSEGESHVL